MSLFQPIEDTLSNEEMDAMNQWALNTSRGVRNHEVARNATSIVLMKLWNQFDPDLVDAWCQSLVKSKLTSPKKE